MGKRFIRASLLRDHTPPFPPLNSCLWEGILGALEPALPQNTFSLGTLGSERVCGGEEVLRLNGRGDDPVHRFVPPSPTPQDPEQTGSVLQWVGGFYLAEPGSQEGPGVQVSGEAAALGGQEGSGAGSWSAW